MSDVKYEDGVFCWVDLMAHDIEAAKQWYGKLFGWETTPTDEHMHYSNAMQDGKMIAGIGGMPDELKATGMPAVWNSYVYSQDAAKVEAAAREHGGEIVMPTMQIAEHGSMLVFRDPGGASIGVWQPGEHRGAGLVNEPNSLCWNELATRKLDACKQFYSKVLGWTYEVSSMGDFEYSSIKVGERHNGGILPFLPDMPDVPSHWMVYFAVADTDAMARKCEELGGTVHVQPEDIPNVGRFAVLSDPQGAVFSVIKMSEPSA